jgi:hypothetical protein
MIYLTTLAVDQTIYSRILRQDVQIPGARSPVQINVLTWRLIFVSFQYGTSSCHHSVAYNFCMDTKFL